MLVVAENLVRGSGVKDRQIGAVFRDGLEFIRQPPTRALAPYARKAIAHMGAHYARAAEAARGIGSDAFFYPGLNLLVADLAAFVDVAPTTTESLRQAGRLGLADFEDAMQVAAGLACSADVIATRNTRDYRGAPIEALPPGEVVARVTRTR